MARSGRGGRSMKWLLVTILALGLLARLLHFWVISGTAYPRIGDELPFTDMYVNLHWARTILAGDWLGRETYHPYFHWMKQIAPLETWYRWWGGKEIFQQAPLYPYLLAGLLALCKASVTWVLFFQLLIGALQPLVLYWLAASLFGARVGLVAAVLTALYGPFIFHQGVHLRDWLPPLLEPLALFALLRANATNRGGAWGMAGAALGLALLTKETVLLFLPFVGLWLLWENWPDWRRSIRPGALLLGGFLLCLSPLLLRNALVGAPVFALSNRAAESIIEGNAADGSPVGLDWPRSMQGILERSGGRLGAVVLETLGTYQGDWIRFLRLLPRKVSGLVDPFEVPNNVSFYYGLELSPVLRLTLGYGLVFPLGLVGFLMSLNTWRRHFLAILYGLTVVGSLMVAPVIARYRLTLVPVLILYAAVMLIRSADAARERNARATLGIVGLVLAACFVQRVLLPLPQEGKNVRMLNPLEYLGSEQVYVKDKEYDRAAAQAALLLEKARRIPDYAGRVPLYEADYRVLRAQHLIEQGANTEANHELALAVAAYARLRETTASYLYYNIALLYFKLGEEAQAERYLRLFLEQDPDDPKADEARWLLLRLKGSP